MPKSVSARGTQPPQPPTKHEAVQPAAIAIIVGFCDYSNCIAAIIIYFSNFAGTLIVRPRDVVLAGGGGGGDAAAAPLAALTTRPPDSCRKSACTCIVSHKRIYPAYHEAEN
jgi:hypothetical protein